MRSKSFAMRLKFLAAVLFIALAACLVRLFYWQVISGRDLSSQARIQYESQKLIGAPRGNIFASDGSWLAVGGDAWLIYAELPKISEDPRRIADKLAPFFVEDAPDRVDLLVEIERLFSLLTKKEIVWIALKHKVTPEVKANIEALNLQGIGFEREESRSYPEASASAHLLGFVGKEEEGSDKGYFGLEGFYDLSLAGKTGFHSQESDAFGIPIIIGDTKEVSAVPGVDLLTHIDKRVQLMLDQKLLEGIEKYGAKGGTAIIANPSDGSILGMSSFPSYDPLNYTDFSDEFFKNPAISDTFEPGSVFKVLVMASALDAGVINTDTVCDICSGPVHVDKYTIETWDSKFHPDAKPQDIIVNSDNVGMVFVGQKLGADKLYDYLDKFGIGHLTEVDLQGEVSPALREKDSWSIVDLAVASFGQGIAITPMQMLKAVSTIANKGISVRPQVVDKLTGVGWQEDIKPQIGERVISEKSASLITAMMVEAAKKGESKWTHLKGFKVAGKTGTAQIPISGHYDSDKTIASFVGFAPADKAKFVMIITLKEPTSSPWASETAAPLWYSIAKDLFPYFGIQPEN